VNTSRKRRRPDADMRSAAAVASAHSSIRDTAFGLHLNNLLSMLWNIGWRNWATFCTLLAASREKYVATMPVTRITCHSASVSQRGRPRVTRRPAFGRATQYAGHAKFSACSRQFTRVTLILAANPLASS